MFEHPRLPIWLCLVVSVAVSALCQEPAVEPAANRRVIIIVGLPGDAEHATRFHEIAQAWHSWFVDSLEFKPEQVITLAGSEGAGSPLATRDSVAESFAKAAGELTEKDALWVLFLGHANYDGAKAWFHVAGPDPDATAIAKWLTDVKCGEQVVWLTNSCAGWFVKPLARPGRIVIAATAADFEFNETEFPLGLAKTMAKPSKELDRNQDQRVSLLELFESAVQETEAVFNADKRVATEHAQLDDDGNGQGTELPAILKAIAERNAAAAKDQPNKIDSPPAAPSPAKRWDGKLADSTIVPYRVTAKE